MHWFPLKEISVDLSGVLINLECKAYRIYLQADNSSVGLRKKLRCYDVMSFINAHNVCKAAQPKYRKPNIPEKHLFEDINGYPNQSMVSKAMTTQGHTLKMRHVQYNGYKTIEPVAETSRSDLTLRRGECSDHTAQWSQNQPGDSSIHGGGQRCHQIAAGGPRKMLETQASNKMEPRKERKKTRVLHTVRPTTPF
ncbi:hypothetical protein MJT46_009202 [Ovis ammon polii x Ovis aries]|nr:hypothetical protein MJT46_009202 [Ovis ammon polii x Ovis aries]